MRSLVKHSTSRLLLVAALGLGLVACKTPEERACANKKKIEGAAQGTPSDKAAVDQCVATLNELRESTKVDEGVWSTYVTCLAEASDEAGLKECLGPISDAVVKNLQDKMQGQVEQAQADLKAAREGADSAKPAK